MEYIYVLIIYNNKKKYSCKPVQKYLQRIPN